MYHWIIFLHVLSVFGFLLGHGASAATAWKLRAERRPERVHALVELSKGSMSVANVCLALVFVSGIAAGFMGSFWGHGWIWAALGVLVLLSVLMMMLGTRSFARIRSALGPAPSTTAAVEPVDEKALAAALRSVHPALMTSIAAIGLGVLLWLMMFKPF